MGCRCEGRAGLDDFHTVGDTILLENFEMADGRRDVRFQILHVSDALWTVPDAKQVRVLGVEVNDAGERGPQRLFIVPRKALVREKATG